MKRTLFPLLLLACAFLCPAAANAQQLNCPIETPPAGAPQPLNASRLCVRLKFEKGRVAFDRAESRFTPSAEFTRRLGVTRAQAEDVIFAQLAKVFETLPPPYRFALTDAEQAQEDKGELPAEVVPPPVRDFSGGWVKYRATFNEWAAVKSRPSLEEIIRPDEAVAPGALLSGLTKAHQVTALHTYVDNSYDADAGVVVFSIVDPINDWADEAQVKLTLLDETDPGKVTSRLKQLRDRLRPLAGRPRVRGEIDARLTSFYRDLGLAPNISFDDANTSPLLIKIMQAPRITGVVWKSLDADDPNVDKILYSLLPDDAFRASLRKTNPDKPECTRDTIRANQQFKFECVGRFGPYLNPARIQIQQQMLNQLGYTLSFNSAEGTFTFDLIVQKTEEVSEVVNDTPEEGPALADEKGVVKTQVQDEEHKTEPQQRLKKKGEELKDKKRYLGFGGEYRPGQGLRLLGLGQLTRLPPGDGGNVSATGGGNTDGGALGSINYFADYVLFGALGYRRLSLQLTTQSDVEADRALTAGSTDERRNGGSGRAELELFRDRGGSLLRFYGEGRRETVALKADALGAAVRRNQTTLDLGALYSFESQEATSPGWARLEPKLRMGLGLAAGEPRFNKWVVTGAFHRKFPNRFELDFAGRAEAADRRTPIFELPSFGGAEVVRGFRRDDALGRKLWGLQNEVWVPLPVGGEGGGLKALLRQSAKLAPFVDFGGLYDPVRGESGARAGAGLGLRLIYNPIVFKFDYAYGFGPAATGGSRGKFHFAIVTNLPF